jgi:CRP-like cAMP-binding protein
MTGTGRLFLAPRRVICAVKAPRRPGCAIDETGGLYMYEPALLACPLFERISISDVEAILSCLSASRKSYEKRNFIFLPETPVVSVGILLSGSAYVVQDDFWGNRRILARIEPGGLFGESCSCAEVDRMPFAVIAAEKSTALFVNYKRITTLCSSVCAFHARLIQNMLHILAEENMGLMQKIEHITRPTIREKLSSYLSSEARKAGAQGFVIPFNRQDLADYLGVDRSAMSHELCKMRDEGLLRFKKNHFELTAGGCFKCFSR